MQLTLYRTAMALARPLLMRKLRRRGAQEPLYLHAVHQRFAEYTSEEMQAAAGHAGEWVWLHAVSLGETRAAAVLVQALREARPGMRLLLTNGTATGRQEGEKLLQPGDLQVWMPWDSRAATRRFVETFRPRLGLLMETEIWPEILAACDAADIPVVLANARMSDKTLRQSLRFASLARRIYGLLQVAYAQTAGDAGRLQQLGVPEIVVTGNLKFDARPDPRQLALGHRLRSERDAAMSAAGQKPTPVLMLASSREGEEQLWVDALAALPAEQRLAAQWLLVPRHPQRFDEIAALLEQAGWKVRRRSAWGVTDGNPGAPAGTEASQPSKALALPVSVGNDATPTVWLGDSMGEMVFYYALADLALMGGSFAPLGGQNLIEACACGCPVLLGPHTFNFAEASEQAIEAGAALRCEGMAEAVKQALELGEVCKNGMSATEKLSRMEVAALEFSQRHQGAAQRIVRDIEARGWLA
ncbi:3-deoxy-D-manno-octulosonic acid transferase [Brachymonas denitrificans]|uniref:3-deoxy-D-manno-octulosonic acid transferase n=1 Tax=Brachymonas denitrificans DSM 15123 TaxID=1121117 RepID=A0A1H8JPB4_9BURK|nr:3-deoxy-D-manno-octulosonic acid transferase [Brachymonas denitrificans]SEN82584.1 3-deoxy-D-manno-octulosonic-acid transferase [Brachymonas denitrificans DSM 15123]